MKIRKRLKLYEGKIVRLILSDHQSLGSDHELSYIAKVLDDNEVEIHILDKEGPVVYLQLNKIVGVRPPQ
jgi:hypothetical protein